MQPITVLILGFLLGLKHATDADHVVAVTTIVTSQKKLVHAALVGAVWGIGHTLMILIVGVALILFHISIPEQAQLFFELFVAVALIILGVLNLSGVSHSLMHRFGPHQHPHTHDEAHIHPHNHLTDIIGTVGLFHFIRPLIVGLIHGLAGSAAITLLILGSITDGRMAALYLGIFGLGTITGMMLITTLMGIPILAGSKKFEKFDLIVTRVSGYLSILYGVYFGYHIVVTQGLFR